MLSLSISFMTQQKVFWICLILHVNHSLVCTKWHIWALILTLYKYLEETLPSFRYRIEVCWANELEMNEPTPPGRFLILGYIYTFPHFGFILVHVWNWERPVQNYTHHSKTSTYACSPGCRCFSELWFRKDSKEVSTNLIVDCFYSMCKLSMGHIGCCTNSH